MIHRLLLAVMVAATFWLTLIVVAVLALQR